MLLICCVALTGSNGVVKAALIHTWSECLYADGSANFV